MKIEQSIATSASSHSYFSRARCHSQASHFSLTHLPHPTIQTSMPPYSFWSPLGLYPLSPSRGGRGDFQNLLIPVLSVRQLSSPPPYDHSLPARLDPLYWLGCHVFFPPLGQSDPLKWDRRWGDSSVTLVRLSVALITAHLTVANLTRTGMVAFRLGIWHRRWQRSIPTL